MRQGWDTTGQGGADSDNGGTRNRGQKVTTTTVGDHNNILSYHENRIKNRKYCKQR